MIETSAVRPRESLAMMRCLPGTSDHPSGVVESEDPIERPSTFHSISPLPATALSESVWNSRRSVGSIMYVALSAGLTIENRAGADALGARAFAEGAGANL